MTGSGLFATIIHVVVVVLAAPPPTTDCPPADFKSIALKAGTDKVTSHNYAPLYERWLGPIRCNEFNFLEWGFAAGNSAVAWRRYLPHAHIGEIEIGCYPDSPWYGGPKVAERPRHKNWLRGDVKKARLYCGNAVNFSWVEATGLQEKLGPLTVVIDDGGHSPEEMALAFFYWMPRLLPGGLFFMEDLGTSYFGNAKTRIGFVEGVLKPMVDMIQRDPHSENTVRDPPYFAELDGMVQGVHCEQQICVFERSSLPPRHVTGNAATAMWKLVRKNGGRVK